MFILKRMPDGTRAFFNLSPRSEPANKVSAIELPIEGMVGETVYLKTAQGEERPVITRRRGGRDFLGLVDGKPQYQTHNRQFVHYHIGSPIVAVVMVSGGARIEADWCGRQPGDQFYFA